MPGHGVAVAVAALVGKVPGEDDLPPSGRETRQRDRRSTARPAAWPHILTSCTLTPPSRLLATD